MTAQWGPGDPPLRKAAAEPPHPSLTAMLICDTAIREEGTKKISLIGVFENIRSKTFPVRHSSLCVFAKLSDAQGVYQLAVNLVRLEDLNVICHVDAILTIEERLGSGDLLFGFLGVDFERPGRYEFRLRANNRDVGGVPFNLVQL